MERSGNVCMVITVLGADKASLSPNQSHELEENNEDNSFAWIQMVLTPPRYCQYIPIVIAPRKPIILII